MDPVYVVLIISFGLIFMATATITICALPGWIKIPNSYLKILFSSLILEVVACIFIVFEHQQNIEEQKQKPTFERTEKYLVLLNRIGEISQLTIDSVGPSLDEFSSEAITYASFELEKKENNYLLKNKKKQYLGYITEDHLRSLKLSNKREMKKSGFERITFVKKENKWERTSRLPDEWSLRLNVNAISDVDTAFYNVKIDDFNVNNRSFYSFTGSDGADYFVRISDANLSSSIKDHFVTYMIIRTEKESNSINL